jgi:hypothetical protein
MTVNSLNDLVVGQYITIAGAGPAAANLETRVIKSDGTNLVHVETAASTTVSGAAVSYTAPTLTAF